MTAGLCVKSRRTTPAACCATAQPLRGPLLRSRRSEPLRLCDDWSRFENTEVEFEQPWISDGE
jgi:hypothetical protein